MKEKKTKTTKKRNWSKRIVPLAAVILLVAGFLAYSNSFDASFHWDDGLHIVQNDKVHDLSTFSQPATWKNINLRPLSLFSLSLNWQISGEDVFSYHLVNLLLHILAAFLVFLLTRFSIGLLSREKGFDERLKNVSALFAALLFLLHPIQTMAVTYIIQRMTIMAALFYILAVFLYAKGRMTYLNTGLNMKSVGLLILAFFSGVLAVLSKQNAITFPAAFILYELFFIRKPDGRMCRKYIITGAAILLSAFVFIALAGLLPAETDYYTRIEYLSAQFGVFHKYLFLIFLPISQTVDYFIRVEPPLFGLHQIIGLILILSMIGLGIYLFKKNKLIAFGIFWFLITMSVESGLIPIKDIMMEHRMYLPLFGVGMILSGIIMRFVPFKSIIGLYVVGTVVFILLAFATYQRNKAYESELTLWEDCLEKNPENPRAMVNFGMAIKVNALQAPSVQQRNKDLYTAIGHFSNSMNGDTVFVEAYVNRGLSYFELGKYDKALQDFAIAAKEDPKQAFLKSYIEGVVLAKKGSLKDAMNKLDLAVRQNEKFAPLYTWRGLVAEGLEQHQKAIDNYKISLDLDPSQTILYINLSQMYFYLGNYKNALVWIKKARAAGEQVDQVYIEKLEQQVSSNRPSTH